MIVEVCLVSPIDSKYGPEWFIFLVWDPHFRKALYVFFFVVDRTWARSLGAVNICDQFNQWL